jgi:integrase
VKKKLLSANPWKFHSATLRRAGVPYFRVYDLRSTCATRLSAGGVAEEWVEHLLRQGDAKVFKKYSQMKLQRKREALKAEPSDGRAQGKCFKINIALLRAVSSVG